MKRKHKFWTSQMLMPLLRTGLFFAIITFLVTACFLHFNRTTTVYGTITDHNGDPVDSILVVLSGTKFLTYEDLKQVYSDENGKYEIVAEVPKKLGSSNVTVPHGNDNPKYDKNYNGKHTERDGKATNTCCSAIIGKKTKYDFELIPK